MIANENENDGDVSKIYIYVNFSVFLPDSVHVDSHRKPLQGWIQNSVFFRWNNISAVK